MGKGKSSKGGAGVAQKHLHSRISFLYQASNYLTTTGLDYEAGSMKSAKTAVPKPDTEDEARPTHSANVQAQAQPESMAMLSTQRQGSGLGRQMSSQMRAVSLKSQIRLAPDIKRAICKRCDSLLIYGTSCIERIENPSHNGAKPWADVLVISCNACGTAKRYSVGTKRQPRKNARSKQSTNIEEAS